MTDRRYTDRIAAIAVIVLVLASSIAGVGAAVESEGADLAIQQPTYVDDDVREISENGTPTYVVRGERINIRPQNFDPSRVVDYGVATEGAELSYNDELGIYEFSSNGAKGTFEVYWIVNRDVEITVERNNSTTTETREVSRRYTARLRVEGETSLIHRSEGSIEGVRADAEKWRDWNATIHSESVAGPGADTEAVLQSMVDYYRLVRHPLSALAGNYTAIGIIMFTSLGGFLWYLQFAGYHVVVLTFLRRKVGIFESVESDEGEVMDRIADLEHSESLRALANMDWNDIYTDDHVAAAWREDFGTTVLDGWETFKEVFLPENLVRDRLQAMSQAGYVGVVEDRTSPDGSDDEAGRIESVRLAKERTLEDVDDQDVVDLSDPDDELLEAVDWDDPVLQSFDLSDPSLDLDELETDLESMDLDEILDALDTQLIHFDDPQLYGMYIEEFLQSVRDHPITDETGRERSTRYVLNEWLKTAHLLDDRYAVPYASYLADSIERALIDFDPGERAEQEIERIQDGGS